MAQDFEDKAFRSGDSKVPVPGDVLNLRRFRCLFESYFDPFEPAYTCRHTRQKGEGDESNPFLDTKRGGFAPVGTDIPPEPTLPLEITCGGYVVPW